MYVFSNHVRAENGVTIGTFSSHGAALTAMYRQWNPEYEPLNNKSSREDLDEESLMSDRIKGLINTGLEVV